MAAQIEPCTKYDLLGDRPSHLSGLDITGDYGGNFE